MDQLLPDPAAYNIPAVWRLQGALEVGALARSLEAVVARHEALRTRIVVREGVPVQVIDPPSAMTLPVTDLDALPPAARETQARALAEAEARQPFDFAVGPVLRAQLLRLDTAEHWLLLTVHHIAADGWSMGVLHRELAAAYAALVRGTVPAFTALPIQYADYAVWQRGWLQGAVLEEQLAYWRQTLAGVSPLALPTDRPRLARASSRGALLTVALPRPMIEALTTLGRRAGATLFMTLLAAFDVLLARHSGQDDVAVGTPMAGRRRPELEGLIGFFVNTLVLRTDLSGTPSFRDVLGRVRARALDAYTHQDLPFEKLVEELAPARDLSRQPLFQAMFVLQNTPGVPLALEGLDVSRVPLDPHSAKCDLTLSIRESDAGWHARWAYASDLFDASTIERLAGQFQVLLEAIVADPEQRIDQLPLLTAAARHQVLVAWNETAAEYPRDRCIHQLFADQAARTPAAVAVVCDDRHLTYAELDTRANQLAHHLIALGVGPEVLVGICVERSLDLVVGVLGILKAGGAYVPLDPAYPRARLAFMLADTDAPVLLTQQRLLGQLPSFEGHVVGLDRDWPTIAAQPTTTPPCRATAETLAYVIYTSGSTGTPKGVAVPHRSVLRLLCGIDYAQLDERQTFLLLSSISFDASTFELWGALLHGARCVIVREPLLTVEELGAILQRHHVSTLWLTASLFNLVVDQAPQILGGVRQLLTGGEALSPTHVRAALTHLPDLQLINGYGPTEGTTFTCCHRIPRPLDEWCGSVSIGRPIGNTRVYVLDRGLNPVPVGVAGELCIGGDGLARGYLHRPELTAEKFLPDPFSTVPGARLYRTGDLARYRPDGTLEFLGRLDEQVKIRGFRVEPGEIEAVLAEHPAVRQAVVVAREDAPGDRRLVAYVVPTDAAWTDTESLRTFVRARLPDYLCPAAYVRLDRLPLTPTGKIDRQTLPQPDATACARRGHEAPVGEVETLLAQAWEETLTLTQVGRHDDFFDLGGHSLLAVKLVGLLRDRGGVYLPIGMLFESPTPAGLAERLSIEPQSADSGDPGGRGAVRLVLRPHATGASSDGHLSIDEILGRQREWVRRWKGSRRTPESLIVTLNESGTRQGLFWCLQAYSELAALAKHLGRGQPVHGMRSGHHVMTYTDENVRALASRYAAEMIAMQPEGPFVLGGNCQGGRIAEAIARRLRELGRTVSLLILMERRSFKPYDGRVALIFGRDSSFNPYVAGADPDAVFRRVYPAGFTIDIIAGVHNEFFRSPNVKTLAAALKKRLAPVSVLGPPARFFGHSSIASRVNRWLARF